MNRLKAADCCVIQGWMSGITLFDSVSGKERKLSVTELIIIAKLYGFLQDDNICKCSCKREYLAMWANASDNTISRALQELEANDIIRIKSSFNKEKRTTKNTYILNKVFINKHKNKEDKEGSLVKRDSYIVIPSSLASYYNSNNIKTYSLLIHAIINQFSSDGVSYFTGSKKYIAQWLGGADERVVRRAFKDLLDNGFIDYKEVSNKYNNKVYWTTISRTADNMKTTQIVRQDKMITSFGQNRDTNRTEFDNNTDNLVPLNSSERKSEIKKESEVEESTTTFLKILHNNLSFVDLSHLTKESSFQKKVAFFTNIHKGITEHKFSEYVKKEVMKFNAKENFKKSPGLFIKMFFSDSDYELFSKVYDAEHHNEEIKLNNIKINTVTCPVCGNPFIKNHGYGVCSCCELEEEYLTNEEVIKVRRDYYYASDEKKAQLDNEAKEICTELTKELFFGKDKLLLNQEKKMIDNKQNSFNNTYSTKEAW